MATSIRIQCINKTDRSSVHERIANVGGINGDNTRWKISVASAIAYIENGTYAFYVSVNGVSVDVVVAVSQYGYKYLKTKADSTTVDNLLKLPECP